MTDDIALNIVRELRRIADTLDRMELKVGGAGNEVADGPVEEKWCGSCGSSDCLLATVQQWRERQRRGSE